MIQMQCERLVNMRVCFSKFAGVAILAFGILVSEDSRGQSVPQTKPSMPWVVWDPTVGEASRYASLTECEKYVRGIHPSRRLICVSSLEASEWASQGLIRKSKSVEGSSNAIAAVVERRDPREKTFDVNLNPDDVAEVKVGTDDYDGLSIAFYQEAVISNSLHLNAENNGFAVLNGGRSSHLCTVQSGELGTCFTGFYNHQSPLECEIEPIYIEDGDLISCSVITARGSGVFGEGDFYFFLGEELSLMGFLPTFEYISGWGADATFDWKSEDEKRRFGDSTDWNAPWGIEKCVLIKAKRHEDERVLAEAKRCSRYHFDFEKRRIIHVDGKSVLGGTLMDILREDAERLVP